MDGKPKYQSAAKVGDMQPVAELAIPIDSIQSNRECELPDNGR